MALPIRPAPRTAAPRLEYPAAVHKLPTMADMSGSELGNTFLSTTTTTGTTSFVANQTVNCEFECPTISAYPHNPWLWILTILYATIAVASLLVMSRGRSKMFSFRNVFLLMQSLLCIQRVIIFSVAFDWNLFTLLLIMYCLPIFIQFVTFSLLIVFLIKCLLVMQERAHLVKRYLYPSFAAVIVAIGIACVVVSYSAWQHSRDSSASSHHGFDQGVSQFAIVVFGVLTLFITVTGYKTHRLLMRFVLSEARRKQVSGVSYVVVVYCIIFCARAVWSLLYMLNDNSMQNRMNHLQQSDASSYYLSVLIFYLIFEILPTTFLLYSLYNWARPNVGGYAKIPDSSVTRQEEMGHR